MMAESEPVPVSKKDGITVIIAMDGSEYSDYALQFYVDYLHKPGNQAFIAHTTEYKCISHPAVAVMSGGVDMAMVTKEIQAEERKTTELVEHLKERMKELVIDGKIERIHGEPGPAIITLANEKHADYIVVGCRGKSQVRKTLTGSVTDYITHHSHVPVVVARHQDHLKKHHVLKHPKKHDEKGPTSHSTQKTHKTPTLPTSP